MNACVPGSSRSEEHTSELQSLRHLVCRLLLEKKKNHLKLPHWPLQSTASSPSDVPLRACPGWGGGWLLARAATEGQVCVAGCYFFFLKDRAPPKFPPLPPPAPLPI